MEYYDDPCEADVNECVWRQQDDEYDQFACVSDGTSCFWKSYNSQDC